MSDANVSGVVILCFAKQVVGDVYALGFESSYRDCKVISCSNLPETVKEMSRHPGACVVLDAAAPRSALEEFLRDHAMLAKRTHVFVLGGDPSLVPQGFGAAPVEFLPAFPLMKDVMAKVEAALSLASKAQQYCRISLKSLLVRTEEIRCDVYIKLSDEKFVKVLNSSDHLSEADYERFRAKNVDFLYLARADFLQLMDDLLAKVSGLNKEPGKLDLACAFSTSDAIFQTVHAAFATEGFTPELQNLSAATANLAVNTIKAKPKLGELLARLDANRGPYLGWHSVALSFLTCKLATLLGWHSEATFYKLSLASFLHDLTLPNDDLAQLTDLKQINIAELSLGDRTAALRHPRDSAQLISGMAEIPGEVSFIVEQHHERQDGKGFPAGLEGKDISSISALFIIAHDIVATMYEAPPSKFKMHDFIDRREFDQRYAKGTFAQVFRALASNGDKN